jgi:gamma-glutamyltranspeptidase/glutathione hydrolase
MSSTPTAHEHLVQNWVVKKPLARSRGGIVASQNRIAAQVGARVLADGGNAVDAAVATGFSLAACEPWNSGLGGIGFMMVYIAAEDRVYVVDFGPKSPGRAGTGSTRRYCAGRRNTACRGCR